PPLPPPLRSAARPRARGWRSVRGRGRAALHPTARPRRSRSSPAAAAAARKGRPPPPARSRSQQSLEPYRQAHGERRQPLEREQHARNERLAREGVVADGQELSLPAEEHLL